MKKPSETLSPEMIAKFREAQSRSQELACENKALAQMLRDMERCPAVPTECRPVAQPTSGGTSRL